MSGKPDQKATGQAEKAKDKPKPTTAAPKPAGDKKPEGAPAKPQGEKKPVDKPSTAAPAQKEAPVAQKPAAETKTAAPADKPADGKKPAEGKGPRQPREKKEGEEQGKDRKKEGGDKSNRRPKTEGGEGKEGEKKERKKRTPRERNDEWKTTLVITIDTPVPPLPEKPLAKPDPEKLKKDLEDCDRKIKQYETEIEALKVKREKWRQDQKKKLEEARRNQDAAYKDRKEEFEGNQAKFDEHKQLKKDLEPHWEKIKALDEQIKELTGKQQDLERQFMTKSAQSIEQVLEQIESIDHTLANDKLTGTEEKKLLAEKFALNKSIPVAKEYGILSKQIKELRDKKRPINEIMKPLLEKKKPLDEEIKAILKKKEQDAPKNEADKKKRDQEKAERKERAEKGIEGEEKKEKRVPDDPFSKEIEEKIKFKKEQYQRKDRLRENHHTDWQKYLDQQDEIYKSNFIKNRKEHLVKIHNSKQDRAKKDRARLLERYIEEHTPQESAEQQFSDQTNACDNLIPALAAMLPQNRRLLQSISLGDDAPQLSREEIEARLKDDKKLASLGLKLAVKQVAEPQGGKKKDNKKKADKKPEQPTAVETPKEDVNDPERKLILDLVVREYFDILKLTPPSVVRELESSIAAVEKKKLEIAGLISQKAEEIKKIHEEAEKNVPSIDEIISQYKDVKYAREDGKGDHGHKDRERRGARGGRSNAGTNVQFRGPGNAKQAKRQGDQEPQDNEDDNDSYQEQKRAAEKERHKPKPQKPLVAEDFPSI